jgi:hypothetical protein
MSRKSRYFFVAIALLLSATLTVSVYAKKGGNGGGGGKPGGEDPPPVELPPVRYQIQFFDMPAPTERVQVFGISELGQVVGGYSDLGGLGWKPFLYDPAIDIAHAVDLNAIVLGIPDGWVIRQATAINAFGDISVYIQPTATPGEFLQAAMIDMSGVMPQLLVIRFHVYRLLGRHWHE